MAFKLKEEVSLDMPEEWYEGAYFNRKFRFRFGDCDILKRGSLYAVMKLLSELSGEDYERRGLGYDSLAQHGQALLLSRMRLRFSRLPSHMEKVVAVTWERCVKGPFFYRDYEIKTESGELIASGSSNWFLVDITSRNVLRPNELPKGLRQLEERKSDCPDCEKLKKIESLPIIGSRPVFYSDLDANGHINNAVYARIATDFLPPEYRNREVRDYLINFCKETKLGETLDVRGGKTGDGYIIHGFVNGGQHFASEFTFR